MVSAADQAAANCGLAGTEHSVPAVFLTACLDLNTIKHISSLPAFNNRVTTYGSE